MGLAKMWFKQARIFELSDKTEYKPDQFEEKLSPLAFRPCLPSFYASHGWAPPIGDEEAPLVHAANGFILLCLQIEEKVLPAAVIQKEMQDKIKKIRDEQDRKVSRKEKQSMKEDITIALLPRAFSKLSRIHILIDTQNNWLIIDSVSAARVEKCLDLLKKSFSKDFLHAIETKKPVPILTSWLLNGNYPAQFSIEDACVLKDETDQRSIIRCQKQDLNAAAIHSLIKSGCNVHQLLINWQDKINFTLADDFSLKSIRYHGNLLDLAKDQYTETPEQRFDTDFFIMSESLSELISSLLSVFSKSEAKESIVA